MRALRLLGALGLALGATLAAPALPATLSASVPVVGVAPAAAAGCEFAGGITVVVDYNQLSGSRIEQACAADGGGRVAFDVFEDAGARQTVTREFPGFICRVNGLPGTDTENCRTASPADAYWSLWWTDGKGGDWIYSNLGARSLRVPPDGGYLAWSWQGQSAKAPPSVAPSVRPSAPSSGGGSGGERAGGRGGASSGEGGSTGSDGSGSSSPGASSGSGDSSAPGDSGGAGGSDGGDGGGRASGDAGTGARAGKGGGPDARTDRKGRAAGAGGGDRAGDREEGSSSESSTLSGEDGESLDSELTSADTEDPAGLPGWVPFVALGVLGAGGLGAVLLRRRTSGGA